MSPEGSEHAILDELTPDHIRNAIFGDNGVVQRRFRELFGEEIDRAIAALAKAHSEFQRLQAGIALEPRAATVQLFIHAAINSIIVSLHHLVSGYPISSGHMMRHYTESIAMALMCSDERTRVYKRYEADRKTFPVQKAPGMLRQNNIKNPLKESLGFEPDAWETILQIAALYGQLSHASALALGHQLMLTETGGLIIGAEFDPAKADVYGSDVVRRRSAAESLAHIIPIIMNVLPKKPTTAGRHETE